ncbi:MAG TPA: transglutaminase-like domain-containing protein [Anaerolineae bacterium]|nr:transglutaminase-like domain-containing protein [Anaerolineae bacterium]
MLREQTDLRTDLLNYYAQRGPMTDPQDQAHLLNDLPTDIPLLVKIVQGVIIHPFWMEHYGLKRTPEREELETNLRFVNKMLGRISELDDRPLTMPRDLDRKLIGNCRDHSTLLCAILRHQGVPARARCGFGAYFMPNHYEDHWVGEYWNAAQQRWVLVDAQLDQLQRDVLKIPFDTLDVPRDQFIIGGRAWQMIRSGDADPNSFGIFDWRGQWFVQDDLVRDFLSLNKIELLPWDGWGLMAGPEDCVPTADLALLDRIAALTIDPEVAFDEIRSLYASDPRLNTRPEWWR